MAQSPEQYGSHGKWQHQEHSHSSSPMNSAKLYNIKNYQRHENCIFDYTIECESAVETKHRQKFHPVECGIKHNERRKKHQSFVRPLIRLTSLKCPKTEQGKQHNAFALDHGYGITVWRVESRKTGKCQDDHHHHDNWRKYNNRHADLAVPAPPVQRDQ